MNAKQKHFADLMLTGTYSATQAYKEAYGVEGDNTAAVNGSKLLSNAKIIEYMSGIQQQQTDDLIATRHEVMRDLTRLARMAANAQDLDAVQCYKDAIKISTDCMKQLSKMSGWDAPTEVIQRNVDITPEQLEEELEKLGLNRRTNQLAGKEC
jgi:phage terminase small subunit